MTLRALIVDDETVARRRIRRRTPANASAALTDASGRTLSGQTCEAFWFSLRHAEPLEDDGRRARWRGVALRALVPEAP